MKTRISLMLAVVLVGSTTLAANGPQKHKPKHAKDQHAAAVRSADRSPVAVHVVFSPHDAGVIREYYAPRYRNLPPGLQKTLARGGRLPPGWQKKIQPFPAAIERGLVVLPQGYRRG